MNCMTGVSLRFRKGAAEDKVVKKSSGTKGTRNETVWKEEATDQEPKE